MIETWDTHQGRREPNRLWNRLNDDVPRMTDGVRRAWSLTVAGRSDREHKQLIGGAADGVKMVLVVPKELIDLILGEESGIRLDGTASVEMKDLQPARSRNSQ